MLSFENGYIAGAHPEILKRLAETNLEPLSGYGTDPYCASAREKIRAACQAKDADVYFLVGGTQTNSVVISSMLHSYDGVLCADTGHINTHEAGAIEYTGHKVLPLPQKQGKISPNDLERYLSDFYGDENHEHMVFPGMVYISHPTEYGTLYTKEELTSLSELCRAYHIPLYMDGALLATGRLLGIQFDVLFTDDLYLQISKNAVQAAEALKSIPLSALPQAGLPLLMT